jgi:hypothetical protein
MEAVGWFNFADLYDQVVERLAADSVKCPRLAEVGVFAGASVTHLARQLLVHFPDGFGLFAVDHWDDGPPGDCNNEQTRAMADLLANGLTLRGVYEAHVLQAGCRHYITDVPGDSVGVAEQFEPDSLDFVFIDADHSVEGVRRDVEAWVPRARILAGHDLCMPSVREGLALALPGVTIYEMPHVDCWTTDRRLAEAVNALPRGVLLATPLGTEAEMCSGTVNGIIRTMDSRWDVKSSHLGSSIAPHNFNCLLCEALNHRQSHRLRWFVMLHSDVIPIAPSWLDDLLDLHAFSEADVISVVLPIKDGNGLTSTALDTDPWRPRRLTMTEIMDAPETFDCDYARRTWGADLLVNTGLMAFRLDKDLWPERVVFNFRCTIRRDEAGLFVADVEPEDWGFSRWCNAQGLKLVVTRRIPCLHKGRAEFNNCLAWGAMKTDTVNVPAGGVA